MEKSKTLEDVKFGEIEYMECMVVTKLGKKVPVCRVHTFDGKDYQVEPTGIVFEKERVAVNF